MTGAYRFLPWVRQGLATQVTTLDAPDPDLPSRARFPVRVRVNGGEPVGVDVTLYGPGDIVGVDPRGIVRTDPRRHATDVEPNYMAGIEFDRPDFPWMFTPTAPAAKERLRPWCVLVVLEKKEGVAVRPDRNRPLPAVTADLSELPPLDQSWAWAHGQAVTENDTNSDILENLKNQPNLNVSRILCPRRLEPDKRYLACLVPSFAAGVLAGLGVPRGGGDLTPAWTGSTGTVDLPVYYHWEFATGPGGDFESLARKLAPPKQPLKIGISPMYVGRADPGLPSIDGDEGVLILEGGLVGPLHTPGPPVTELLPIAWLAALEKILEAPALLLASGDPDAPPVSPPLYGEWHSGIHVVPNSGSADEPVWMREVNLDPRFRAIAGLAAQVVRANQEELMHDAWRQVGNLLAANNQLDLARFAREVALRLHRKVFQRMSPTEVFLMATPMHSRVLLDQLTVTARLHASVVPDATADPAFRRITSERSPVLRRAMRIEAARLSDRVGIRPSIVERLDTGAVEADPANVVPDGLARAGALDLLDLGGAGLVDLSPIGGKRSVDMTLLRAVQSTSNAVGTAPAPGKIRPRLDLVETGMVFEAHLQAAMVVSTANNALATTSVLADLVSASARNPDAGGFALPLDPDRGVVIMNPLPGQPGLTHRTVDTGTINVGLSHRVPIDRVPIDIGPIDVRPIDVRPIDVRPIDVGPIDVRPIDVGPIDVGPIDVGPTDRDPVVPPLTKDPAIIARLGGAVSAHVATMPESAAPPLLPPLGLTEVRAGVLARTDPGAVVQARVSSMIRIAGDDAGGEAPIVAPGSDLRRFTGAPRLERPMYEALATYAPERLLPGIGEVPTNTVALVKTNPRFVEAFLIGANSEMGAELVWREYPARRDGTPLRHFWDRADGAADIPEIRSFDPAGKVGDSALGGADGDVVLLVRGDLLRRYPSAAIYAVKSTVDDRLSKEHSDHREPVMRGRIDPDVTFIGFDLSIDEVLAPPGFFFVIQQQPTEPRFGFDVPVLDEERPAKWRDASWAHVKVEPGGHIDAERTGVEDPVDAAGATFVTNAAHLAAIALQQPVRVAIHARDLIGTQRS